MTTIRMWAPAVIFALGSVLTIGIDGQRHLELRRDLGSGIPAELLGLGSVDQPISEREIEIVGVDDYLFRSYSPADASGALAGFTLYVGYYGSQSQGRTIHSPKNCLPGAGWEVLQSREVRIAAAGGEIPVNRYLLQRDGERALVLYWYQGRGRVEANEYRVKFDLLRDSAFQRRSDEALVRIVVPITTSEEDAFQAAARIAGEVAPAVESVLPS